MNDNDILSPKKHGFCKEKSTLLAIVEFLHDVYMDQANVKDTFVIFLDLKKAFDTVSHKLLLNKLKTIAIDGNLRFMVIFLDFKKAFDTVSHKLLLNKLKTIGLDGNLWFKSYLQNRTQNTQCYLLFMLMI